jgi:lipopolysaccharide biosynthesis regulator YciM
VRYLKKALSTDRNCARASLILAKIETELGHYKQAIRSLKQIYTQDPDFFSEAILPLAHAYRALGNEKAMAVYFKGVLKKFPKMPIAILLSERIRQWRGDKVAADFVADYVRQHPSIVGLHHLVKMYLPLTEEGKAKNDLRILCALTEKLISKAPLYQCSHCGFSGKTLHWQCPSCKRWSSTKPTYALQEEQLL